MCQSVRDRVLVSSVPTVHVLASRTEQTGNGLTDRGIVLRNKDGSQTAGSTHVQEIPSRLPLYIPGMQGDSVLMLALLIGFVAGLRSMTAPAAVCWAAYLGWLDLGGSALAFMGSTLAVIIFSVAAIAEFAADLHPATPSRTSPGPLLARIVLGGLSGAALALAAGRSLLAGALLGGAGGLIGAFVGYQARVRLTAALRKPKLIALLEDLIAIVLAVAIVSR
jgi:uncharacterized membrane protein